MIDSFPIINCESPIMCLSLYYTPCLTERNRTDKDLDEILVMQFHQKLLNSCIKESQSAPLPILTIAIPIPFVHVPSFSQLGHYAVFYFLVINLLKYLVTIFPRHLINITNYLHVVKSDSKFWVSSYVEYLGHLTFLSS